MLRISLITITYNSASTLEDTIRSVADQNYPDLEYIIKDGGSKDDTLKITERYKGLISNTISGTDNGLYDAMNTALQLATGDIIGFLHSDDLFAHKNVLKHIAEQFQVTGCDAVYGDLVYVDRENPDKIVRTWKSGEYTEGLFLNGWMPPHPTFYVKREVYERYGAFNTSFKTAADYELMLRFIHRYRIKLAYLPEILVKMRAGGQSNVSVANRLLANKEDREAWRVNGLRPRFYTLTWKPLRKVGQFFRK